MSATISLLASSPGITKSVVTDDRSVDRLPRAQSDLLSLIIHLWQAYAGDGLSQDNGRRYPPIDMIFIVVRIYEVNEHGSSYVLRQHAIADAMALRFHPCWLANEGPFYPSIDNAHHVHLLHGNFRFLPCSIIWDKGGVGAAWNDRRENQGKTECFPKHMATPIFLEQSNEAHLLTLDSDRSVEASTTYPNVEACG